jgi:hypothetical protein
VDIQLVLAEDSAARNHDCGTGCTGEQGASRNPSGVGHRSGFND